MPNAAEIIKDLVGEQRYPKPGWEAFAYYLEDQRGSKDVAQLDIHQLWQTIELNNLDGDWLRIFSDRDDVKNAAARFASDVRAGKGPRNRRPREG